MRPRACDGLLRLFHYDRAWEWTVKLVYGRENPSHSEGEDISGFVQNSMYSKGHTLLRLLMLTSTGK